jgi:hypothetical protein
MFVSLIWSRPFGLERKEFRQAIFEDKQDAPRFTKLPDNYALVYLGSHRRILLPAVNEAN